MKKLIIFLLLTGLFLTGCAEQKEPDYSAYLFTDVIWTRDSGHDIETIIFQANGDFRYITTVKIVVMTEDVLELDFNGEIRKFEKET